MTEERIATTREFIRAFLLRHHTAPTVAEMEQALGFPTAPVLNAMKGRGMIAYSPNRQGKGKPRTLRLAGEEA